MQPILYIKQGCPWCNEAQLFFAQHSVPLHILDVVKESNMRRMIEVSGQTKVPTFEFGEFVVADFSVDEFLGELDQNPEVKKQLSMAFNEE